MKPQIIRKEHPAARAAIARWGELKTTRSRCEGDWNEIARLIRPQRGGFGLDSPSMRSFEKPLGSEPVIAHSNFAAGIYAGITNPASSWFGLQTPDDDLNKWPPMAQWLDRVMRIVRRSFSPSLSSFYPASYQAYADLAAFGNAAGYDEIDREQRKFVDVTLSLAEVVVDIDFHGRVAEIVRKFELSPRTAVRHYGADVLPERLVELAGKPDESGKVTFYQHVTRNDDFVPGRLGHKGKRWLSLHACEIDSTLVRVQGYDEMPFYYPRWDVDSGMTYGTGPGFVALASARVHHRMEDATIRAAQNAADPTKLAPDRNVIPLNGEFRPGQVIYGAVDVRGNPLVRSMDVAPQIGLTVEEKRAKVEAVKEAFYYAVMSLTGRTGLSDQENRIIEEARLRNWAPHADRVMEEMPARKVERRFKMLWRAGQIPPPPEEAGGNPLQVQYQSAAAQALRASETQAMRAFLADIAPLAEVKPRLLDRLNEDELIEALHDASPALPAAILHSREDADRMAQDRQQAQQAQQAMQMAQAGGGVVKDLAAAAGAAQGGGQ